MAKKVMFFVCFSCCLYIYSAGQVIDTLHINCQYKGKNIVIDTSKIIVFDIDGCVKILDSIYFNHAYSDSSRYYFILFSEEFIPMGYSITFTYWFADRLKEILNINTIWVKLKEIEKNDSSNVRNVFLKIIHTEDTMMNSKLINDKFVPY